MPTVPVGGPATTTVPPKKGAKPAPPPPPPNPGPILTAVHTDLSQLQAISDYQQARADVATKEQGVTAADLVLLSDQKGLDQARAGQQQAENVAHIAAQRLQQLAIAAYIGLGYTTPAAGPQILPGGFVGTVEHARRAHRHPGQRGRGRCSAWSASRSEPTSTPRSTWSSWPGR